MADLGLLTTNRMVVTFRRLGVRTTSPQPTRVPPAWQRPTTAKDANDANDAKAVAPQEPPRRT